MRSIRFAGMMLAADSRQLQGHFASYAKNTRLWDGRLRAYKKPRKALDCKPKELAYWDCLECIEPCTVQHGLCTVNDRVTAKNGSLFHADGTPVGMPRPTAAPTVSLSETGDDWVYFRYSTVNDHGEESPKSDPSPRFRAGVASWVTLKGQAPMRVYAYPSGQLDGSIADDDFIDWNKHEMLVGEFDSNTAVFPFDFSKWTVSGDGYDTDDWCTPEACCIVRNEDMHFATYSGKNVWVSERNLVHAYPRRQMVQLDNEVKALLPYYDVFFALTDGEPELIRLPQIQGGAYDGMVEVQPVKYANQHPLEGPAVKTDFGVMYVSRMGIVALTPSVPTGLSLVTRQVLNEDTWVKYKPTAAVYSNGVFYGWNDKVGFAFDMKETNQGQYELQQFIELDGGAVAALSGKDGVMYYGKDDVQAWDDGTGYLEAIWHSKWYVENGSRVFTTAKIVGENITGVEFELWYRTSCDGEKLLYKKVIDCDKPFRLPRIRALEYQIRLKIPESGKEISIHEFHVAPSIQALTREM